MNTRYSNISYGIDRCGGDIGIMEDRETHKFQMWCKRCDKQAEWCDTIDLAIKSWEEKYHEIWERPEWVYTYKGSKMED